VIRVNTSLHWLIKLASFCWMHTIQKYLAHQDCIDVIQVATLCCQYNIIFCEYTFYRSTYEYPIQQDIILVFLIDLWITNILHASNKCPTVRGFFFQRQEKLSEKKVG